jgi:hypothetical protein
MLCANRQAAKANAPDRTTGNAVSEGVAAMLESRGIAMRLKQRDCGHLENLLSDGATLVAKRLKNAG